MEKPEDLQSVANFFMGNCSKKKENCDKKCTELEFGGQGQYTARLNCGGVQVKLMNLPRTSGSSIWTSRMASHTRDREILMSENAIEDIRNQRKK